MARSAWWRWWRIPWSSAGTAFALVAAAAVPAFLVTSASVWRSAAEDDIARRAVTDVPLDRNGLDVAVEAAFEPDGVARLDDEVAAAYASVGRLEAARRSAYTLPGLVSIGPPSRTVGPAGRLFAQEGALDAVEVVAELPDTDGGVWVTTWFAERHGLALGDGIGFEAGAIADEQWNDLVQGGGSSGVFPIVGLYEPLWSEDPTVEVGPYWATEVPPEVVPTFIGAFDGPDIELVLTEEDTILRSGLTGVVRWRAPLASLPQTFDGLVDLRSRFLALEASMVGETALGAAFREVSTDANRRPQFQTDLVDTVDEVVRAAARLVGPIESVRMVGIAIGICVVVAAGWFTVDRRRSEYRLLVSEGEGPGRIGLRAAGQLATPWAVGAGLGLAAGVVGPWWFGPADGFAGSAIPWAVVGLLAVATLAVASVSVGWAGSRAGRDRSPALGRRLASGAVVLLAASVVFLWVQIGRTDVDGVATVDLAVVGLPVVTLLLAVSLAVALATWLLTAVGPGAARLPHVAYLAIRRFAAGALGLQVVAVVVGLGVGLVIFAGGLTSTLDRTVDVKLATEIGGRSSVVLPGPLPPGVELPPSTTVLRTFDTVVTPGRTRTRIVAVDAATFARSVTWPAEFGSTPGDVVARLDGPVDGSVPAVAISGEPIGTGGSFGLTRTFTFRVVDRVAALPLAGTTDATVLVDGDRLDRYALDEAGYGSVAEANGDNVLVPTQRFRARLVSQASLEELVAALDRAGVVWRDPVSADERRRAPDVLAARAAFGFLGVLGVVAGVCALAALALFLAARRRARAVAGAMTRSMGLSARAAAGVTAIEVGVVATVAVVSGLAAVPVVIGRLSTRFDPAPSLPPDVPIAVDWRAIVGGAAAGVAVVSALVWVLEQRAARTPIGEVLRGEG